MHFYVGSLNGFFVEWMEIELHCVYTFLRSRLESIFDRLEESVATGLELTLAAVKANDLEDHIKTQARQMEAIRMLSHSRKSGHGARIGELIWMGLYSDTYSRPINESN